MKTKLNIILLLSILLFQSCDYYHMFGEKRNLEIISKSVEANAFKIEKVKNINYISKDTTSYIELTFLNSKIYNKKNINKPFLTSFCAIQAYQLFNPKIWNGKDGISIVFKNKNDKKEFKKYYELKDLQNIKQIIANFNDLIESLEAAKTSQANNDNKLDTEDSLKIASFLAKRIFEENKNTVNLILQAYKSYNADLNNVDRKYFFQELTIPDTVSSKTTNSHFYQLKSNFVLPINSICKIECIVNKSDLDKIAAIKFYNKEEEKSTAANTGS